MLAPFMVFFSGGFMGLAGLAVTAAIKARKKAPQAASTQQWQESTQRQHRDTQVTLRNGLLSVTSSRGGIASIDLATVEHISVTTNAYGNLPLRTLELRRSRSAPVQVPILADGFADLLTHLREIPGFDEGEYRKALRETKQSRHVMLQKSLPINATLIASRSPDTLRREFDRGFAVGDAREERWISLDNTVEEFARLGDAAFRRNAFDSGVLYAGPARFGDLQLDEWQAYLPDGPGNLPLKELHLDVVLARGDRAYWTLKKYLSSFLGDGEGWEREDSNQWRYERGGVLVEITYWYNSDYSVESEYCSLRLTNLREYPQHLVDACSDQVDLTEVEALLLPFEMQGPTRDFRRTSWVKETPPAILSLLERGGRFIVWKDKKNHRIGFAHEREALIIPYAECGEIRLLNVKPAKGSGYSQLSVREQGGETARSFRAGDAAFNELVTYREAMEGTLGFPIHLIDDLYDD